MKHFGAFASALLFASSASGSQRAVGPTAPSSPCSPNAASIRAAAAKVARATTDRNDIVLGIDRELEIGSTWASRNQFFTVGGALVMFPYQQFRFSAIEALRKREPLSTVAVVDAVTVVVSPSRIDEPDIIKVILEGDGKSVVPIAGALRPTVMATRIGTTTTMHKGTLSFPCSAFRPGAKVTITVIPDSGSNETLTFDDGDLMMMSPKRADLAATLVGRKAEAVESRIGKPDRIDKQLWSYDVPGGVFRIFWVATPTGDIVSRVDPEAYDLAALKK